MVCGSTPTDDNGLVLQAFLYLVGLQVDTVDHPSPEVVQEVSLI